MNWLSNGILGVILYGFFALFNKLSSGADNTATNLIIQGTYLVSTTALILLIHRKKVTWSLNGFIAGILGSTGTWIILTALDKNNLIIVYPFAALASIVFIFANFVVYKVTYTGKKLAVLTAGMLVSCAGLFFAAVGGSGGWQTFVQTFTLDSLFLLQGFGVLISWGLLAFFWFRARVINKEDLHAVLWWTALGSFLIAALMIAVRPSSFSNLLIAPIFPILSGLAVIGGSYFVLKAFGQTKSSSSIQNVILAVLTNAEIIPVTLFALLILREYSLEGILGSVASIIGIVLLNVADDVSA